MDRPEVPEAIRASLPPALVAYVEWLEAQVAGYAAEVSRLRAALAAAEAKAQQHSGTSSRPPSSDPPAAPKRPATRPTGRQRGGQPGHPGHQRGLVPLDQVTAVEVHRPTACPECGGALAAEWSPVGEPVRHQIWDIPAVVPAEVIEHQYVTVVCPQCQQSVAAERPVESPESQFGVRTHALVALLHGRYRLSMRETVALLGPLWALPLSVGSIPRLCARMSTALAAPYAEAQAAVQASDAVHLDETGWRCAGQRAWLWIALSTAATCFLVAGSRAGAIVTRLLGETFTGIVHSDRFRAYRIVPMARRQLCWAHLDRNFAAVATWPGAIGLWGQNAQELIDHLFHAWHRCERGEVTRDGLIQELAPIQAALRGLLARGVQSGRAPASGLAAELLEFWPALWTFVTVPGVGPTNNAAERGLRPAVLRRKGSFGTQSDQGSRFVERLMTVSATCQQHDRPLFPFLLAALSAQQSGLPAPRLLPSP